MRHFATVALASLAVAVPVKKRQAITDVDVLQYALTLEHLENVFYKQALSQYPEQQWIDAGFSQQYYDNLKYIAHDEEAHVQLLTSALQAAGATPVQACSYSFPYTDPQSFVALSAVLEGVGTSAYLGGAPAIQSNDYLTVAGSILVTEALHTSLQRYSLNLIAPANPYGTPLGPNEVYTLAAAFITSCPQSNPPLPFSAFPTLTATQGIPTAPGISFTFESPQPAPSGTFYATFISGLATTSMPATIGAGGLIETMIAPTAEGQTYVVLTSANVTSALTDDVVIAGPAILEVTPNSPTYDISIQKA